MRKVLITRFAAYGDHIHTSHLPRLLKEKAGFDYVAFEYNPKGYAVYKNNPYIDEHIHFDPFAVSHLPQSFFMKRCQILKEAGNFEKHIILQESIEKAYLAMEDQSEYYMSEELRRERFGGHNYYDQVSIFAGYPEWVGEKADIFFTEEEERIVRAIYNDDKMHDLKDAVSYKDKFIILCNISGTSKHKLFYQADVVLKEFLRRHEDAVVILVGDEFSKTHFAFEGDRIVNRCGGFVEEPGQEKKMTGYPFRQSMLMAKHADLVIGCESGLMVAANALGAPTVQMMTAASIKNHGGDFVNDYSLQSPAACSPCHKGPYDYIGCPKFEYLGVPHPVCIKFDPSVVLNRMEEVYAAAHRIAA